MGVLGYSNTTLSRLGQNSQAKRPLPPRAAWLFSANTLHANSDGFSPEYETGTAFRWHPTNRPRANTVGTIRRGRIYESNFSATSQGPVPHGQVCEVL